MLRATDVIARGDWSGAASTSIVLDFDERHRRRIRMEAVNGQEFLLDLPESVALRSGDALKLEDGQLIEVIGAPEPIAEISVETPDHLLRLAWHLGNRHLQVQVESGRLRIRRDHVIEEMISGLGGRVRVIAAPFDPEGGAYAQAKHKHEAHKAEPHVHDASCGHGHHHGHDHHHAHTPDDHHHDHAGCCGGHHGHKHG